MVIEEEGVIIILDALGTKGIWSRIPDASKYVNSWESLVKEWKKNLEYNGKDFQAKFYAFSDTIIVKETGKDLDRVLLAAAHNVSLLMLAAISKGIFFRGCISVGKIFSSENMIIGRAVDEAAEYYTQPNWIGVSTSPSAYTAVQRLKHEKKIVRDEIDKDLFTDYDIPLKIGVEKGVAINYPSRLDLGWDNKDAFGISTKMEILTIFQKQLEKTSDLSASLKIRNSIEFIKHNLTK